MKKTLAIIFALVLSVSFVFTAYAAEYTVDEDGVATYDTAVGYVFDIEDVDGQITGEDATLLTSVEGIKKAVLGLLGSLPKKSAALKNTELLQTVKPWRAVIPI